MKRNFSRSVEPPAPHIGDIGTHQKVLEKTSNYPRKTPEYSQSSRVGSSGGRADLSRRAEPVLREMLKSDQAADCSFNHERGSFWANQSLADIHNKTVNQDRNILRALERKDTERRCNSEYTGLHGHQEQVLCLQEPADGEAVLKGDAFLARRIVQQHLPHPLSAFPHSHFPGLRVPINYGAVGIASMGEFQSYSAAPHRLQLANKYYLRLKEQADIPINEETDTGSVPSSSGGEGNEEQDDLHEMSVPSEPILPPTIPGGIEMHYLERSFVALAIQEDINWLSGKIVLLIRLLNR